MRKQLPQILVTVAALLLVTQLIVLAQATTIAPRDSNNVPAVLGYDGSSVRAMAVNTNGYLYVNATAPAGGLATSIYDSNHATIAVGQATMSSSLPVAIASNQTPVAFNQTQWNGTTVDTGSGNLTSGGTLRVVLATNQPTNTNNLNVAVAAPLPAGSNTIGAVTQASGPWQTYLAYTYSHISTNATTTVKSSAGVLHTITINTAGTSETATIYDNTAGSGTVIGVINGASASGSTLSYDVTFNTGLTVVTAGTTAPDITVSYR